MVPMDLPTLSDWLDTIRGPDQRGLERPMSLISGMSGEGEPYVDWRDLGEPQSQR